MNPKYKNGVIVLGLGAPLLVVVAVFIVLMWQKSRVSKEHQLRVQNYEQHLRQEKQSEQIRATLSKYEGKKEQWNKLITTVDISAVNLMLDKLVRDYPEGYLKKSDFKFVNRQTGAAQNSSQPSMSFDLVLDGTYGSIQESLLVLESQLPHLTLNQMKIGPSKDLTTLNVNLSYSVWAN